MRSFSAFAIVLLATYSLTSSATLLKLQLTRVSSTNSTSSGFVNRTPARLYAVGGQTHVQITNIVFAYVISIGFGEPPQYHTIDVDTGSSNTWCGAVTPYNRTSTSFPTGDTFNVTYGTGNVFGDEYLDRVTLVANVAIYNQSIGAAILSNGFAQFGLDGILGLGPIDLTKHTLSPDVNSTVPTVMDNLVLQNIIEKKVFSVYFAPSNSSSDTNGQLILGGVDNGLVKGNVTYTPVTKTYPSSRYWGLNITLAEYGNHTIIPNSTAGILDTGTTQILLTEDYFDAYVSVIPGAKWNSTVGLLQIPELSISSMKNLSFVIADRTFTLVPSAQVVPKSLNVEWGGDPSLRYGVVGNLGYPGLSGQGFGFIFGQAFLERYYSIYDAEKGHVGLSETKYTFAGGTE